MNSLATDRHDSRALMNGLAGAGLMLASQMLPRGARLVAFCAGGWMLASTAYRYLQSCSQCMGIDSDAQEKPDSFIAANRIDEASWESFPASDPPAAY